MIEKKQGLQKGGVNPVTQAEQSATQWLTVRNRFQIQESRFFFLATTVNFIAFSSILYLLYIAPHQNVYFFGFAALLGLGLIFSVVSGAIRYKRSVLESKLNFEGVRPIYDRTAFFQLLKQEQKRAGRYHFPLTLCYLEIDELASVEELQGKKVAAQLNGKFADLLASVIRTSDYLCHLEENGFAVLLCHTDVKNAENFLLRLHLQSQERLELSFSSGLTSYRSGEGLNDFLKRSREALKQAQKEGDQKIICAIGKDDYQVIKSF